jgi:glycosyltransferase involved in cell wall biosynthesis
LTRILYFTRDYTTHDRRFLAALAETDHQVVFLQLERRGHSLEDRPLPERIERIAWAGGRQPFQFSAAPRLLSDLKRVIRQVRPDLVHAGPLQTAGLLAALSGFRPLVSMSWGYDLLIDAGRNAFLRGATRYTLKHSDVMVGDCATIRQRAEAFGMRPERIVTFPWGIDLRHFRPDVPGSRASGEGFTLLSTRGWEPIYGVDVIAGAFCIAAQQASSSGLPPLRLVMLGNGSLAQTLRRTFMQAGVLEQVSFPGQVGYGELPGYYRSADLYVSASHSDGTSISLLEAMACGRPALVSNIPGNREWVTPGVNGWWFPDGDPEALADGILKAIEMRPQLPDMGCAARGVAERRANWENNFPELLKAYSLALEKH